MPGSTPGPCRRPRWAIRTQRGQRPASSFPADFISEAIDQTRGWFYSLLAVNTLVFGQSPYRHVVCLGHIVDTDGRKMSKSVGNVIDPWEILGLTRGGSVALVDVQSGLTVDAYPSQLGCHRHLNARDAAHTRGTPTASFAPTPR